MNGVKDLNRFARVLAFAGVVAVTLAGCGKDKPEALIESAKVFSANGDYRAAVIQLRSALQKQPENGEARFILGNALNEEMDYVTAEKELRKALEYGYTRDGVYTALARAMLGQGQGKQIVADFSSKTLADPEAEASLKTDLGLAYFGMGQRDEAGTAFAAALQAKPGYGRARIGQAMLLASNRDLAGAMKIVDEVLAAAPALPDALSLKADLLIAQNDTGGAIKAVEQVAKIQPYNFQARYALASMWIREQKLDDAAAEIAELKKTFPKDARVSYLEALLAFRRGDAAKTRDAIQEVLKINPVHLPSLFLAGAADYQLQSFDSAAEYFQRVLSKFPRSTQTQIMLISAYLRAGKPDKAQEVLDVALRTTPNDPKVLGLAGEAALANNDLAKASRYFEQAAGLDKESAQTRTRLGQVRLAIGETDRAMKDLESASELDATGYAPDLALIAAHLRRNEIDKALEAAATLEKKQPKNPQTYNVKGVIYMASHDNKNARANFARALELQFNYLPAVRNLALLDIAEKNPTAAQGRFEEIIAKEPKNDEAMISLAGIQAAAGAPPKDVLATLERAVAANPASVTAKIALANYQLRNGDPKSAVSVLQGAAATNPNDTRILELLGVAQAAAGDNNQAIATFNKLVTLQPKAPGPLLRLAQAHFAVKDYERSIQALRAALALKPDSLEMRREIIAVEIAAGKTDDALAEARAIEKERPKDAVGFIVEGDVYSAQKKWDPAAAAYREALKRQKAPAALIRLHATLQNQGKTAEANTLAANWIRENPKDANVRAYLAERALKDKNFKDAIKLYKEILPLQPENPLILNNLAWAAMETKDPDALGYAERAYAKAPENASVLDTYGWLLLQKGDVKRAVEMLTAAVKRAPTAPDIRLHLAKALVEANDKPAARKEVDVLLKLDAGAPQRVEAEELLKRL